MMITEARYEDKVLISIRDLHRQTKARLRSRLFSMVPTQTYVDKLGSFCLTRGKTYYDGTTWYTFTFAHLETGVVTSGRMKADKDDLHVYPENIQVVGSLNPHAEPFQQGFLKAMAKFANQEKQGSVR